MEQTNWQDELAQARLDITRKRKRVESVTHL